MLTRRTDRPPPTPKHAKEILERIRQDGYDGSEKTLENHLGDLSRRRYQFWGELYEVLSALDRDRAVRFLFYLYRADTENQTRAASLLQACKLITNVEWRMDPRDSARRLDSEWMRRLAFGLLKIEEVREDVGDIPDLKQLMATLRNGKHYNRMKAIAFLAHRKGIKKTTICSFAGMNKSFVDKNLKICDRDGVKAMLAPPAGHPRRREEEGLRRSVFRILHAPPRDHGFNRAAWSMQTLREALINDGNPACADVIRQILKSAGYSWRKARIVLTSNDTFYKEKVARVREVASQLRNDEALFSIDEFGPFHVRKMGGRSIVAPGKTPVVQQRQKSRGLIIPTAAIELSSNQVTHFYSDRKNSAEMIKMLRLLRKKYRRKRKLWISWDAASWHKSDAIDTFIDHNNGGKWPKIESLLLPASGQYLNIIESIFSGMARAIIHNSDYVSLEECRKAIDEYFLERNTNFRLKPQRAGKNIWGKEREPVAFSESNDCKEPAYNGQGKQKPGLISFSISNKKSTLRHDLHLAGGLLSSLSLYPLLNETGNFFGGAGNSAARAGNFVVQN
jgi:transposase